MEVLIGIAGPSIDWHQGEDDDQDPRSALPGEGPDLPEGGHHAVPLLAVRRVQIADVVPSPVAPHVDPVPPQMEKPQDMGVSPPDRGIEVFVKGRTRIDFRIIEDIAYDDQARIE